LSRYYPIKRRKLEKLLKKEGFEIDRISGDHAQYKHTNYQDKKRLVTVPLKEDEFSPRGRILKSIIRQMGLKKKEFYKKIESL
jgi:predicted RNA binding protein YcfA (HicA-like mRNA interferase family)